MLYASLITNPNRCLSICSETFGWVIQTNKLSSHEGKLINYAQIAKGLRDTAAANYGVISHPGIRKHKIIGIYDEQGNLQAGASVSWHRKKNILKLHKVVTALWNATPEVATHLSGVKPVKGAGYATIAASMRIGLELAALTGKEHVHLFLEPTKEAVEFYVKAGFTKVTDWVPKEFGSVCGMSLKVTKATLATFQAAVKEKGSEESTFTIENNLPRTNLHFEKMLPGFEVPENEAWN